MKYALLFEDQLDKNLDQYVDGKIYSSQWKVLMAKSVCEAWPKFGKMKDSIIHSFKKSGLSVALDRNENDKVNIEGLPEYQMRSDFVQDNEFIHSFIHLFIHSFIYSFIYLTSVKKIICRKLQLYFLINNDLK